MKTSLWIVVVIVTFFVGVLVGFALSPGVLPSSSGGTPAASSKTAH